MREYSCVSVHAIVKACVSRRQKLCRTGCCLFSRDLTATSTASRIVKDCLCGLKRYYPLQPDGKPHFHCYFVVFHNTPSIFSVVFPFTSFTFFSITSCSRVLSVNMYIYLYICVYVYLFITACHVGENGFGSINGVISTVLRHPVSYDRSVWAGSHSSLQCIDLTHTTVHGPHTHY